MKILQELREQGRGKDVSALIDAIPYAKFIGLTIDQQGDEVITVLPFSEHLVGNVNLPAVHGGAVGAMLEMTAVLQLIYDTQCERLPKTVDVSFDYLRSVTAKTTFGRAIVTRQGRRVANVRCELWQDHRDRPVAAGHGHFLLSPID
ncbi:MAG: PaaI family thioesterase [Pseudomonadota bacterium]